MARFAIINDVRMCEVRCVFECTIVDVTGRVAGGTILRCRQVADCFTGSDITVMTRHAVIRDAHMIKRCRYKSCGYVAGIAFLTIGSGRYVIKEFACSNLIIVAGRAVMNERGNEFMAIASSSETTR